MSGTVIKRIKGRETLYSLREKEWRPLLSWKHPGIQWLDWKCIYSFMIAAWTILDDSREQDEKLILSELILLLTRETPSLPGFLSEPFEAALRGSDQTRASLPSTCNALEEFIRTLMG